MKHEVRNIFVAGKVETVRVGCGISVGVAVPQTGKLYPLPPEVVRMVPYCRSCEYFRLANDRIVIVDPINLQIPYILGVTRPPDQNQSGPSVKATPGRRCGHNARQETSNFIPLEALAYQRPLKDLPFSSSIGYVKGEEQVSFGLVALGGARLTYVTDHSHFRKQDRSWIVLAIIFGIVGLLYLGHLAIS